VATKQSPPFAKGSWHFSLGSCLAFLALEAAYFIVFWDLKRTTVDPGMMAILAVECWFMLQISTANVKQKHKEGATSKGGMLYTRVTGLALLALMAATLPSLHVPYPKYVAIAACIVTCFGRIMWLRQDTARSYLGAS
jgi:hypothetical protein